MSLKPEYPEFPKVLRFVGKTVALFCGVLFFLCGIKKLMVLCGFLVSFEHVFVSVVDIVVAWAWPFCVLFVIYLFRNVLGELLEAFGRIYKGKDYMMTPSSGPDSSEDEFGDESADGTESVNRRKTPKELLNERLKDIIVFKSRALNCLQREKQILISRHVRLFNAGDFDGAYRVRDTMYGVRVKWKPTLDVIERELANLERFYRSLTDSQRSAFKAVLCFNSGAVNVDSINQSYERQKCTVPIEPFECRFNPNKLISNINVARQSNERVDF